jgi:hypothetical protein
MSTFSISGQRWTIRKGGNQTTPWGVVAGVVEHDTQLQRGTCQSCSAS